ncbi:MAG: hypothetical protein L3J36_14600 [Rhodobacteraceae bacterium]|nr:hypothetical protein [Paracoccaceae bacterium]
MKFLGLVAASLVSACSQYDIPNDWSGTVTAPEQGVEWGKLFTNFVPEPKGIKYVEVLGRSWAVFPLPQHPGVYVTQRDNLDLNPYGAPPYRRTPQAIRAVELATGCKVVKSDVVVHVTARYFTSVNCS